MSALGHKQTYAAQKTMCPLKCRNACFRSATDVGITALASQKAMSALKADARSAKRKVGSGQYRTPARYSQRPALWVQSERLKQEAAN